MRGVDAHLRRTASSILASATRVLRSVMLVVEPSCTSRVLERVAHLPLSDDATLTVVESSKDSTHGPWFLLEQNAARLSRFCRRLRWTWKERTDVPSLLDSARTSGAELIMIGDAGLCGWRAARLMGRVPVLLVRSAICQRYRRPLVAIDLHNGACDLVRFAQSVLPTPSPSMTAVHAYTNYAEHAVRDVADAFATLGTSGLGWTRYFGRGGARVAIAKTATDTRADLVVVGSRRRSLTVRLLLGSVSRDVLHDVSCDVLFVPVPTKNVPIPWIPWTRLEAG